MMKKLAAVMVLVAVGACSGNPLPGGNGGGGGGGGGSGTGVPEALGRNLDSASYNASKDTLSVQISALDSSPITGTFVRRKNLDMVGYEAFALQETKTQRSFLAYFKTSGGVTAGTVGDGGQFVNTLAGGTFQRNGSYSQPTSGLATYEGGYAGLLNTGNATGPLDPAAPLRVQGTVRINADFTNGAINGGVSNRRIVGGGAAGNALGPDLPTIGLEITKINSDGTFRGTVKIGNSAVGNYGGLFGGNNASDVGAILVFNPLPGDGQLVEQGAIAIHCRKVGTKGVPCK
jgi:hypothetical protein